ncbi:MAG: T9SS type A sorting domain-containing protein, partial [Cytophagales bacterium]|nr:T9SS type A sorting domain-containing protein [Cytophagales bacterium]
TLHHFGNTNGAHPHGLLQGADGALYGVTITDYATSAGVVFKINADGSGFKVVKQMPAGNADNPSGGLFQSAGGVLYGMSSGSFGQGAMYRLNTDGSNLRVLHAFTYNYEGTNPRGGFTRGSDGALYGVTRQGGTENRGVFYKINADGTQFSVLGNLPGYWLENPLSELVQGTNGVFYGVATDGGNFDRGGIFRINANGTGYNVLRQFDRVDGENPLGGLIQGSDGALYGMTQGGGSTGNGTIYKLNGDGTGFVTLKHFTAGDGRFPENRLMQGKDGTLYGLTTFGGASNNGVIFKVNPNGSGYQVLRSLGGSDGRNPRGGLVQDANGVLYGTTSGGGNNNAGTLFKINPSGTGFGVLRHLGGSDGANPFAGLSLGSNGTLYGMTANGGTYDGGTLFRINASGTGFTVLRHFNPATYGAHPEGTVLVISAAQPVAGTFRVNAGGNAFATADARSFAADAYFAGGVVSRATTLGIAGTGDDYLYQTGRHGASFSYNFPTGNGSFDVVLHFAETYWGNTAPGGVGSRKFHVNLEGARKLTDYDVFAKAGGARRVVQETFRVNVADGTLNVAFLKGSADNPAIKAIEVLPAGAALTINAGGSAFTSSTGKKFSADVYYGGGSVSTLAGGEIANTTDDALYHNARFGVFSYGLPSGNGTFDVRLHFAETYFGSRTGGGAGSRRFNVDAEGVRRLTNYDIFAKAGGAMRATTEVLRVTVTDGVLNLFFSKGTADNPLVSAIEVVPVAAAARLAEAVDAPESGQITLYPNPVRDQFTVTLPFAATQVRSTTVSDAAGKVQLLNAHRASGEREIQVSAGTLPKGLYLLHLDTEGGYRIVKFARQ